MNNYLLENFSFQLAEKIQQLNLYHNHEDFEFDMKLEEIKLKDFVGKAEIFHKKFLTNLKINNAETGSPSRYKSKSKYDESYDNHSENKQFEEIIRDYERKIDNLRISHEKEIRDFKERFEELRLKYRPELENQLVSLKENISEHKYILEKVNEILSTVYDKYYQSNLNWFKENNEFKYKELEKLNFIVNLINKFFNDNKYLIELISELQKEKNTLIEERNLPFVQNVINKNSVLVEINEDLKNYENEFKKNNENFNEIINYINKNFSNLID